VTSRDSTLYGLFEQGLTALYDLKDAFDLQDPSKKEDIAAYWQMHLKKKYNHEELYNKTVKMVKVVIRALYETRHSSSKKGVHTFLTHHLQSQFLGRSCYGYAHGSQNEHTSHGL
jgi:hypothetical protein